MPDVDEGLAPAGAVPSPVPPDDFLPALTRLRKDLRAAAGELSAVQARYLVDLYYHVQKGRQAWERHGSTSGAPNLFVAFTFETLWAVERNIVKAMDVYTDQHVRGRWAKSLYGIGPVLAGALVAMIPLEKSPTPSALWRFAGLDPTCVWKKGQKRPYNARLKVIAWKIGDSMWKFHNRPGCVYGQWIAERKLEEERRNNAGEHAAVCAAVVAEKRIHDPATLAHYKAGHLPPGRIHLRALRWGAKQLLADFWRVGRESLGLPVREPFAAGLPGHHRLRPIPNWPLPPSSA